MGVLQMGKLCQFCKKTNDTRSYRFSERAIQWNRSLCEKCVKKWATKLGKYKGITLEGIDTVLEPEVAQKLPPTQKKLRWWQKAFKYFEGGHICD
jgi:hypothetical protein